MPKPKVLDKTWRKHHPEAVKRALDRLNKIRRQNGKRGLHITHSGGLKKNHPKGVQHSKAFRNFIPNDAVFQQQKSGYQQAKEDFVTQNKYQKGLVREKFQTAMQRLNQEIPQAHQNIINDAAGRGMLNSGSPLKNLSKYDTAAAQQKSDLISDKQNQIEGLNFQRQQTRHTIGTQIAAARQDAVRRRAQRFGVLQ